MNKAPGGLDDGYHFLSARCMGCAHWNNKKHYRGCDAFPGEDTIPIEIWNGENDHTQPYPGDNGIQFEPKPPKGAKL